MFQFFGFISRCRFFYLSTLLSVIIFLAYFPSLGHVFRSDQLLYMGDMGQRPQTFHALVLHGFDYPRDRLYGSGDLQLFRPLLFILLGVEYWVFGTDPIGWQMTGIVLHILCTVVIFRFLWLAFDRSLAFICALYFAVLPLNIEMVVWQHINFYMLFIIFFYLACIGLLRFKNRYDIKSLLLVMAALTGAVFTYDLGCFVAVIIAGYVFWKSPPNLFRRFLNTGIILMPVVLFLVWDFWSLSIHHLNTGDLAIPFSFFPTMKNFFLVHLKFLGLVALPSQFQIVVSHGRFTAWAVDKINPVTICWLIMIYYIARVVTLKVIRKGFELRGVFIGSIIILALLLTIGRVNPRGFDYLNNEFYYVYMYAAFCLPLMAGSMDVLKLKKLTVNNGHKALLFIALIGSIGYCLTYTLNKNIEANKAFAGQRELLTFVNHFIDQHKSEPGFSFTMANDAKGNFYASWFFNPKDWTTFTFAELVYARYYKKYNWRYRIFYDVNENIYRVQRKNWLS